MWLRFDGTQMIRMEQMEHGFNGSSRFFDAYNFTQLSVVRYSGIVA